jgi:hypothetical protein
MRSVDVRCQCGVMNKISIPADMQPIDITYSAGRKDAEKVSFVCGEKNGAKGACKRKVNCILCEGNQSTKYSHPLEKLITRFSGGTLLGAVVFIWLLSFWFAFFLNTLFHTNYYTRGVPTRMYAYYITDSIGLSFMLFGLYWIFRQLKIEYGRIEKFIPEEYKYHTDVSYAIMLSWAIFALSIIFNGANSFLMGMSSNTPVLTTWIGDRTIGTLYGIIYWGPLVQFFVGLMIFSTALILPRYKYKTPEKIIELKKNLNSLFYSCFLAIVLGFISLSIGTIREALFGNIVSAPPVISSLSIITPIISAFIAVLIVLTLKYYMLNAVEQWNATTEKSEEYMVLEVLPSKDGTLVHVENTHPRLDGKVDVRGGMSIDKFQGEVNTLISVASMMASRGTATREVPAGAMDDSFLFQEKFRDLGEKLNREFIKDAALECYASGITSNDDLTVIIRASGKEADLPWELLNYRGEFLALKSNVVRTSRALDLVKERRINIENVLIVTNDAGSTRLKEVSPLEKVNKEAETLERVLKGTVGVTVLKNEQATKKNVLAALRSGKYQALHFSGHSFFNRDNPLYSNLLLYDDDRLTAYDLKSQMGENIGLQLVFLNSCHSGSASSMGGHDLHGLADALVARGIPYVIGMQWDVTDNGSADFSKAFYSAISRGVRPEEAVRQARNFVAEEYNFRDPIWAAPILYRA